MVAQGLFESVLSRLEDIESIWLECELRDSDLGGKAMKGKIWKKLEWVWIDDVLIDFLLNKC